MAFWGEGSHSEGSLWHARKNQCLDMNVSHICVLNLCTLLKNMLKKYVGLL